ncbi:MAG: TolC family protein [Bacteroidales bacterium]|nr:TolC family protein [Bacteroidales bacterium]MCF8402306.1 TolC family protein [Bacteroidales bacterium]
MIQKVEFRKIKLEKNIMYLKKMKLFALILAVSFLTLSASNVFSQESKVWTLEECINYALDNNINIKKQYLNINYQEELLNQSRLGVLPSVNGYVSHGYNWGQRVDPFTNQFATDRVRSNNLYLQGDLNLFSGMAQLNTIKRNKFNLMEAQYNADFYKDDISISVATEYLQTLYYLEVVAIAKNQLDITKQQVNRTSKLVEAGTLAKGDLLTIEAQEASEELSLVNAENNLALSYLNLSQLMELQSAQNLQIEKPELGLVDQPEIFTAEKVYNQALTNRPEIKSSEMSVESAKSTLKIAQGSYYPRLFLSGSIGSGYSGANTIPGDPITGEPIEFGFTQSGEPVFIPNTKYGSFTPVEFGQQLDDNFNQSLNLSLNIPIFNGWSSRSNVAQAKIGIENANLDLELQKNTLYKTIQQAYNDAVSAFNRHKAANKKVQATSESFKYAEQKFNVGLINSVEYNDAKKEYNNALSELIQAKYDYVFRTTVIDFYLGKPLTLKR